MEKEEIYVAAQFQIVQNSRVVIIGMVNLQNRKFYFTQFHDNEYFSNFEAFILQTNRQDNENDFHYELIALMPDIIQEKDKILDIIENCDINLTEKAKSDFTQDNGLIQKLIIENLQYVLKEISLSSLNAIVKHLKLNIDPSNDNQFNLLEYKLNTYMKLDSAAINGLHIFPKKNETQGTLLSCLDKCKTQIGSRCLKRWLKQPLQDQFQINNRLNAVEFFFLNDQLRVDVQTEFLRKIPDLDKLQLKFYKLNAGKPNSAGLIDCVKLYGLVVNIQKIIEIMKKQKMTNDLRSNLLSPFEEQIENFSKLKEMVEKWIDLEKAESGEYLVKPDIDERLKEISIKLNKITAKIESLRKSVCQNLDLDIKLIDSNQHTFLFSVNKKKGDQAFRSNKNSYKSVSVRNNDIDFTSQDLQTLVDTYIELNQEYKDQQHETVQKILKAISTYHPVIDKCSQLISELDVYCSFAQVSNSSSSPFVKPKILNQGEGIHLKDSRHPILEFLDPTQVVSNDCFMAKKDSRMHIITGPNMGGKSTFIRQVSLCVLLGHIGCFVPCESASFQIVDQIITRVGASDIQLRGISTFMSEMIESSNMMQTATKNSLVIIDELGRGTSTSDGFGLAWAIAQYINEEIQCYVLFATHFHEMTNLETEQEGILNYYVSAVEQDNKLTMLYKITRGKVDKSYGLYVAEMLQFPEQILIDARQKSQELEQISIPSYNEDQQFGSMECESQISDFAILLSHATLQQKQQIIQISEDFQKINGQLNNNNSKMLQQNIIQILRNQK